MTGAIVRVGLVGVGRWGTKIAHTLERLPGVRIAALCDLDFAASDGAGTKPPPEAWASYRRHSEIEPLLEDPTIDAIVIAAPPEHHQRMAAKALSARKHVFVEKPMALSVVHAEELLKRVEETGSVLMVGHLLHYHPAVVRLFEHLREGELGRVVAFLSERANTRALSRGDVWWCLGPHDVSLSRRAFRAEPSDVSARASGTSVTAVLQFPEGTATLRVAHGEAKRARRMALVGTRKTVLFEDGFNEPILTVSETTGAVLDRLCSLPPERWRWEEVSALGPSVRLAIPRNEPLATELLHFIDCLRYRRQPLTDVREGLAVTRILVAGQQSLKLDGLGVSLPWPRAQSRLVVENSPFAAELS